jgi:hypothetical protein
MSAALKVPKNRVYSIVLKWKKFGTTKTLPRAGHPAKLSNQGEKGLCQGGDQEPMITLTELQSSPVAMGNLPEGQPSLQHFTNQAFMVEWPDQSHSSEKAHDSPLGVCQEAPKGLSDHEKQDSLV